MQDVNNRTPIPAAREIQTRHDGREQPWPEYRKFIEDGMEKFFFTGGAAKPQGYVAPGSDRA
jgi:Bacterial Fe(2+) trafficking